MPTNGLRTRQWRRVGRFLGLMSVSAVLLGTAFLLTYRFMDLHVPGGDTELVRVLLRLYVASLVVASIGVWWMVLSHEGQEQSERELLESMAHLEQTRRELVETEKLAALGGLVAGVAHEINTPVGVALTTATQMGEEARGFSAEARGDSLRRSRLLAFTDRMTEGANLLFSNLTRAADLVQSFKQVAVDQVSGERRQFDLKSWMTELVTSLRPLLRKRGVEVDIECPDGLEVETYPGALGQVVTNLVVNAALHAYDEGQSGLVTITVRSPRPGTFVLVVSDTGRGIAREHIGRIFDPFFTTARQRGSTGLGLHIVYNLVVQTLRGRIDVWSEPGRGTRYTIDLPNPTPLADTAKGEDRTRLAPRKDRP